MIKRRIWWLVMNTGFIASLYYGLHEGVVGAERIAMVYAWLCFVSSLGALSDKVVEQIKDKGRAIPAWIDGPVDILCISFMVWHGWILTGVAFLIHSVLVYGIFEKE